MLFQNESFAKVTFAFCSIALLSKNFGKKRLEGQEDNYSDSKPFKVVVGNERWLIKNGIPVDETVSNVLAAEQSKGFISVLCAINGIIYSSRESLLILKVLLF